MIKKKCYILLLTVISLYGKMPELTHGQKYDDQNITGWVMSEKLDGVRAVWDGHKLLSRKSNRFYPHPDFIKHFPPFPLDGELWSKRNDFEQISSIVTDNNSSTRWFDLSYHIFEAPHAKGNFFMRMEKVRQWFDHHPNSHVRIVQQIPVFSKKELMDYLKEVEVQGGEGVMVKNPYLPYSPGRNATLLKVKSYDDMEGRVIGYSAGKGKFSGMVGSLHIELENGIRFYLGSGLSTKNRKNPPPLGSIVTFKYYGLTDSGKPRFASFLRIRIDP